MFITPKLVSSDQQLREVTEEMRNKMEYLRDAFPAPKPTAKSATAASTAAVSR
jgi:type II secretory pathway component GspD/PulD (secretin)